MGKGNSTKVDNAANYQQSLTAAQTKSPTEEALAAQALKTINWADKGDYRDPRAGGIFVNYADPAMLHRNRELQSNAAGQGIEALGVADPNYLATVRANRAAHDEETDAGQYESDIKEGVANAEAVGADTSRMDISRKLGVLGTTSDLYKQKMSQPRWWQYLISGASQAGAAALSNPALV